MARPSRNARDARRPAHGAGRSSHRRGAQARPNTGRGGGRRGARPRRSPLIGWSRRTGIVVALLVLGTSIVLAGQALDVARPAGPGDDASGRQGVDAATGTAAVPPAPSVEAPASALVSSPTAKVVVTVPPAVPRDGSHRLRLYVNGELARERRLPAAERVTLRTVPLAQGENSIEAAITGPGGESLHSTPVVVTRDDVAPDIRLQEPSADAVVHTQELRVSGRTEAEAGVRVRNETTAEELEPVVRADGRFEARLWLTSGPNQLTVEAFDAAGNLSRSRLAVRREEASASVSLTVSREELELAGLPGLVTLRARITDESGAPADSAQVTFSLSAPGQSTVTFRTASEDGSAAWHGARIPRDGTLPGQGFVTVLVVLPSGLTLQDSARFTVR